MEALPNSGTNNNAGYSSTSPELQYNIDLDKGATYFIWVHGYGPDGAADSVHVGIDGQEIDTSDRISFFNAAWSWQQLTMDGNDAYLTSKKGTHTLNIWMREDGFLIDKILLTDDFSYSPITDTCAIGLLNGSLAAMIDWGQAPGFSGSEGSEFVINLQRPDGTWVFDEYNGRPNSAGGTVDPDGASSIGAANDFYSGIATKPQALHIQYPQRGTWRVSVYGWNLRPATGAPVSQDVNISIFVDRLNSTDDDLNRNPTILSWEAAQEAAKSFVDDLRVTEKCGYVRFGSFGDLSEPLTFNKNDLRNAIDNTGFEGGTAIDTGIATARTEFNNNARGNATKIMIVLTDGQNDDGPADVINAANLAKSDDIIIFTIGLTGFVNQVMLSQAASFPNYFFYAPDASVLAQIYDQISNTITAVYRNQVLDTSDKLNMSYLYPDSYIRFNITPIANPVKFGEIEMYFETEKFNDCSPIIDIPDKLRLLDAKVLSYSGEHWTSNLTVNGDNVFQINEYGSQYRNIGDPFVVEIPINRLNTGANSLYIQTADNPQNKTGCSDNNTLIYRAAATSSITYSTVLPRADGCSWTIESEESTMISASGPDDYAGAKTC
jgi:hypothetical protein